ncbi:CPBP family intramembrane metalloprotease [Mycoplasmatota bacterium]|nr:CPBP family intramembrane metalloprotease [Mycoplasmatota bacterium]
MFNILETNLFLIIILLLMSIIIYYTVSKLIGKLIKICKVKQTGVELFISKFLLIILNLTLMVFVKIKIKDLLSIKELRTGIIFLIIGFLFSILIAFLTYQVVKKNSLVNNYRKMVKESPFLIFLTLILLVGPAEDLLFIGILQHVLMQKFDWIAIPIYLIIFTFYHYINVLCGAESKQEFWGMLPIRLMISFILSFSFYKTNTLIYGLIIHNIFDTLCFLGISIAVKSTKENTTITQ